MNTGSGVTPQRADRLTANRPDFPCSLSLSNLVRLDWDQRQELFPHGPGISKLERFGFKGRAFSVESLELGATGNKFVYLYPEKRYYVVPIYEAGQSTNAPQRFLLVRDRDDQEEPGPHIFVVEPPKSPAPDEPFAHLHIIGGEDDGAPTDSLQQTAGIVEAVLTAVDAASDQPIQPPSTPPSGTTTSSWPAIDDPMVADLLPKIDALSVAQSMRPAVAADFAAAHKQFTEYVQKHFGLEHIPITLGQTPFNAELGHDAKATDNQPALAEDVIVGVLRDGYRRDQKTVRDAHVVINKPDSATARPPDKGQTTPESVTSTAKPQHSDEPDDALLHCIDSFNQALGYSPACEASLLPLRDCLLSYLHQRYGWERMPIRINETLFDANLGHYSVDTTSLGDVPDGVIVAVQSDGYTSGGNVARDAKVVVNRVSDRITRINRLVTLSRQQMYLEISVCQSVPIDDVIQDADKQVGVVDVLYSLLAIFALADPTRVHSLAEQLRGQAMTGDSIRAALAQIPSLHTRYLHRTPEMYVSLKGTVKLMDALKKIIVMEAEQRRRTTYYSQADRSWLKDILRTISSPKLAKEDFAAFESEVSGRLQQLTFTPTFTANTAK
jgi:molecular chaperone GrpE (heat shock protein)